MAEGGTVAAPTGRMTVAEFLEFDDGTDTRYELAGGELVAMSPPNVRHTVIVRNLTRALDRRLSPPCSVFAGGGVAADDEAENYRLPDLFVSCAAFQISYFDQPRLLVEVLSRSTASVDRTDKLDFYKEFPTAEAILFVWQQPRRAELHLRRDEGWLVTDTIGQGTVEIPPLGVALTLDEIYADLD